MIEVLAIQGEEYSLDPQNPHKCQVSILHVIPGLRRCRKEIPEATWLTKITILVSYGFN